MAIKFVPASVTPTPEVPVKDTRLKQAQEALQGVTELTAPDCKDPDCPYREAVLRARKKNTEKVAKLRARKKGGGSAA